MNAALVPHQRGKGFSTIALTVVALLCAGCAALVVDVDVYKGPLANTEEIQGEQVMALAMGAKPLLVQLRDHLEVEGGPPADPALGQHRSMSPNRSEIDAALGRLRLSKFYAAGYMPAGNGRDAYAFRNELAIRVNEILGLYEDQADPAVRSTLTEVRELIGEYRRAHDVLEPPSNAIWRSQWRRWKKGLAPKAERTLVSCYDEFFDVERSGGISWRSKTRVMDGVFDGRRMVSTHSVNPSSSGVPMSLEMTNHLAWFETFREVAIHQHAPALFGQEESPERAAFVGAIESICDAYTESRTALRRLFRLTLISLRELGALPPGRLDEGKSRSVAKVLADASVRLVDADKLALYRHRLSSPGLLALADSSALALAASGTSEPSPLEYARIRGVTVEELARPGSSVAAELLDLDEEVAAGSGGLSYPFGLVRGPTSALESIEDVLGGKSGASGLISALSRTGGPLDGGRLREGLEASITRYLAAAEGAEPANRLELPEARNLLAALVAYGQKVAQLGNSVVLLRLSSSSSVRQYVTVLQAVGNSILVHVDELKQQGLHHRRLQQRSQLVARALEEHAGQTNTGLGNWKTNGMDAKDAVMQLETVLRAEYIKAVAESSGIDTAAGVASTLVRSVGATNLALTLASETMGAGTTNRATGATVVTNLPPGDGTPAASPELTLSATLTNTVSGPAAGAHLRRAIEAVTEMREGMIYLRPASAYLRSSYPAAVSARASSQTSPNMLAQMSLRSSPFFGGWYDGVSERDKKTFLALDQQSWQNINRVRVSGAGRVNYVVAKDDIGNWYVKQYSTDRTEVFKTMRNLAFLSAGNAFDGPLPMRGSDGSVMLRTNPVLRLQLSRAEANYAGAVTNAFHALAADATNLVTRIVESLSGFTNGVANAAAHYRAAVEVPTGALTNTVAVARNRLAEVAGKAGATPREVSAQAEAQALALVAALREFSARSAAKVAESTVENLTKEKTTVNQVTRERVLEVIRIRLGEVRDGLATFQDSLAVIRTGAE